MTLTQTRILTALNSVGKTPVSIPLSTDLYPPHVLRAGAAAVSDDLLSVTEGGEVRIHVVGEPAWRALHEFSSAVLAVSLRQE